MPTLELYFVNRFPRTSRPSATPHLQERLPRPLGGLIPFART